jgi:hypothetical protein
MTAWMLVKIKSSGFRIQMLIVRRNLNAGEL